MSLTDDDKQTIGSMIRDAIKEIMPAPAADGGEGDGEKPAEKPKPKPGATPAASAKAAQNDAIRDMVRQAVTDVRSEEKRTAEQQERDARLEELEEREKAREKQPFSMRRVTRALWAYEEDCD